MAKKIILPGSHSQSASGKKEQAAPVVEETFGALVRRLRQEHEITLRQFAKQVGVSAAFLSKVELGQFSPPGEEKIIAIARRLDYNPDLLLARAGKVSSDVLYLIKSKPEALSKLIRTVGRWREQDIMNLVKQVERNV